MIRYSLLTHRRSVYIGVLRVLIVKDTVTVYSLQYSISLFAPSTSHFSIPNDRSVFSLPYPEHININGSQQPILRISPG
jgi:hypothetical protein